MLGQHKIVCDEWAEVWDLLRPYADAHFWRWQDVDFDPGAVYIVGRNTVKEHWLEITELSTQYPGRIVFCNPAEGSQTVLLQLQRLRIRDHVRDGRILLLTSGDLEPGWDYCGTDCYFTNIVDYVENQHAALYAAMNWRQQRPWDFLFLNGRLRPHRKWAIDRMRELTILDHALWSNLGSRVEMEFTSVLHTSKLEPIRLLAPEYEIDRARENLRPSLYTAGGFVKHQLFDNTWGDAVVNPRCYTDTWFSVVTETIYDYPYSFRTEKIWKPILMAHPFVVIANHGYLRDLRAAGFQTFGDFIDESYDLIEDPVKRIEAVCQTVYNIVMIGAEEFWSATRDICKYNQQWLEEYNQQQRDQLPGQLEKFLNERLRISQVSA